MAKTYKPRGSAVSGQVKAPMTPKNPSPAAAKTSALRGMRRMLKGKRGY